MSQQNIRFGAVEIRALFALEEADAGLVKTADLARLVSISASQAKKVAWRLVRKKRLLRLKRGVYLFAPMRAGPNGFWSEGGESIVNEFLSNTPYYVSFLTALNHYGLTEQIPSVTQVVVGKSHRGFEAVGTRFEFIHVRRMGEWREDQIGGKKFRIATMEQLLIDCLTYPEKCGGMAEVSKAVWNGRNKADWKKVKTMAKHVNSAVCRRLGYLLDLHHLSSQGLLASFVGWRWLEPRARKKKYAQSVKWGLRLNRTPKELIEWKET